MPCDTNNSKWTQHTARTLQLTPWNWGGEAIGILFLRRGGAITPYQSYSWFTFENFKSYSTKNIKHTEKNIQSLKNNNNNSKITSLDLYRGGCYKTLLRNFLNNQGLEILCVYRYFWTIDLDIPFGYLYRGLIAPESSIDLNFVHLQSNLFPL